MSCTDELTCLDSPSEVSCERSEPQQSRLNVLGASRQTQHVFSRSRCGVEERFVTPWTRQTESLGSSHCGSPMNPHSAATTEACRRHFSCLFCHCCFNCDRNQGSENQTVLIEVPENLGCDPAARAQPAAAAAAAQKKQMRPLTAHRTALRAGAAVLDRRQPALLKAIGSALLRQQHSGAESTATGPVFSAFPWREAPSDRFNFMEWLKKDFRR